MRKTIRILSLLLLFAASALVAPLLMGTSRAAEEPGKPDVFTCAAVYFSITNLASDPNYRAMEHQYYLLSPFSPEEASKKVGEGGTRLTTRLREGKIDQSTVIDGAKMCSKEFGIPLPVISWVDYPDFASARRDDSAPAYVPAAPAQPTATERACTEASNRYKSILSAMPGQLAAAGPAETNECDDQGRQCGVWHRNSKFYYTLGNICTSLKPVQEEIRRSCGETVRDLDRC